jgi:myosin heavy subunit
MTEDGEKRNLNAQQSSLCEQCNPEAMDSSIQDLVNISDLNEMSILHNLRIRFKEDRIYTNISSILISVNPFKLLPLYTPEILDQYRTGSRGKAPHVFAIAINAYNNMLAEATDQSVVISGESGAGKSEATKLILQFLTDVSHKASGSASSVSHTLEAQILAANPILEAFGNAKTLRNNNSSRFGKLITINFDHKGAIIGGGIINYLLEKSRVVFQTAGERNYHIFYQLLSASETDPVLTNQLKLQAPELFNFTSQSGVTHVDGISDDKDFEDMKNSMNILKFAPDVQLEVFRIVAGVLHFGNLKFKVEKRSTEEDASSVANPEVLAHASSLWGCDSTMMERFLTHRHIGTRSIILVAYNVHQAQDARDAMVKRVYAEMFQFLVDKINKELSLSGLQRHKFIGVLDIFGFESFEVNSFEQLCINFCNEKLQFHFNEHIFKMEQDLYQAEGITIPGTAFVDNQPTLDLLEAKATGVFSMVDEEINVPKGSDDGLLQKILFKHADGKHPNLIRPKARDCKDFLKNFGILHYAGPVFYNVNNFLEKNKDQLHADIIGVLQASSSALISKFFPEEDAQVSNVRSRGSVKPNQGGNSNKKTLGFQFKTQLNDLISTLNATFPHFVRCMKSNDLKAGNVFTSSRMQDQLRYAGLVEVCRIRKLGYPVRRPFLEFYKRYRCIELTAPDLDSLLAVLVKRGILKNREWAKGHSKVFMRSPQSAELELAREASLVNIAILFQKNARRMVAVKKYKYYKKILNDINLAISKREENELKSVIDISFELPWNGNHLKLVQRAKQLLIRIQEEKRVVQLFEHAIVLKDINSLKSAISVHSQMSPPFETPLAAQAKELLARLEEELLLRADLSKAIAARDRARLVELLAKAEKLQSDCNEVNQAKALLARLDQEAAILKKLKEAMERENLDELNALFSEFKSQGMETLYPKEWKAAQEVKTVLIQREAAREEERRKREEEEERQRKALAEIEAKRNAQIAQAKASLRSAIESRDMAKLNSVLQDAIQNNVQVPEVDEARTVLQSLKKLAEMRSQLQAAIDVLRVKSETGIQELDLLPLQHAIDSSEIVSALFISHFILLIAPIFS